MGNTSATGVCLSRDAGTGEDIFVGEYLINAQGEDVVAGIRSSNPKKARNAGRSSPRISKNRVANYPSMEESIPEIYKELDALQTNWRIIIRTCQDIQITYRKVNCGSCKPANGKRTGAAMVKIAMDMLRQE